MNEWKPKCISCLEEILDNQCYFQGFIIPPVDEFGERKFGCAPNHYYCQNCTKKFPHYFSNNN